MTHVPKERGARVIAELHAVPWGQRAHAYGIGDHHVHDAGFDLLGRLARCLREPVDDRERSEAFEAWDDRIEHTFRRPLDERS